METYCVRCKKKTENWNPKIFKTKNGRVILQSKADWKRQDLWNNKNQKDYWVISELKQHSVKFLC